MVGERPRDRRTEDEHPWQRRIAKPANVGNRPGEARLLVRTHDAARHELRGKRARRAMQRGLREHEQRDRQQAAHMDAVVLQQRLPGSDVQQSAGDRRPSHDRQPRHQREEHRATTGPESVRRYEMQLAEPAQRKFVVDGRELTLRQARRRRGLRGACRSPPHGAARRSPQGAIALGRPCGAHLEKISGRRPGDGGRRPRNAVTTSRSTERSSRSVTPRISGPPLRVTAPATERILTRFAQAPVTSTVPPSTRSRRGYRRRARGLPHRCRHRGSSGTRRRPGSR